MENQEIRNSRTEPWNDLSKRVQQLSVETARAQESAERSLSEAAHTRFDTEACEARLQSHRRSLTGLWSVVAILAVALGGATWYGYSTARRQAQGYDNLSAKLPAFEQSLQAAGERISAAESKLQAWAGDWKGWGERLTKLEKRLTADSQLARNYAREQANEVHRQLLMELDNRTEWIQSHLDRIESNEESQRVRLARLQEQIAQVRQEMNQQIAEVRQETGRDLDNLYQRSAGTRRDLDAVARKLDRRRVDFELAKDRNREVIPGIFLTLHDTNVSYQRVGGWVQLVPDGRTLWVSAHGIQQPLIFYKQQDSRPYELVFTRVTKDAAIGYLHVPEGQPIAASAGGSSSSREGELSASTLDAR